MNWLFFALLSPIVYTVNNYIDKYVVGREVKDYRAMPLFSAITSLIVGTVFWIASGFQQLSVHDGLFVILSGVLTIWAVVLYFKAMSLEATSKVIILFQMGPVLTLIAAYVFLKELISIQQLIGFIIIFIAAVGISVEKVEMKIKLSPAFFLVLGNQVMWTMAGILFKSVSESNSFVKIVAYESWGIALGGLLLFCFIPSIRKSFFANLHSIKAYAYGIIFVNEGIFLTARLLAFYAVSLGPISLVSVLGSTSTFFAIILGWTLSKFWPKIFNEDTTTSGLFKKAGFALLAFLGVILIY